MRAAPSIELLNASYGNNSHFKSVVHHGLVEVSLDKIYSRINLEDLLVFEAVNWRARNSSSDDFRKAIEEAKSMYDIFNSTANIQISRGKGFTPYKNGFHWLRTLQKMPKELTEEYQTQNPFRNKNLRERLSDISEDDFEKVRLNLLKKTGTYLSRAGIIRKELNGEHVEMPDYTEEISEILKNYPTEVHGIREESPQLALF